MNRARLLLLSVILLFCITSTATAAYIYQVGTNDGFNTGIVDVSSPSAELTNAVTTNTNHQMSTQLQTFQDFDYVAGVNGGSTDVAVGHTFTGLPNGITGATLEFRIQAGDDFYVRSDQVIFSFVQSMLDNWVDTTVWNRSFGPRAYINSDNTAVLYEDFGLLNDDNPSNDIEWTEFSDHTFSLDLAALPLYDGSTYNLLPELDLHGFLDVVIEDETGVDYMTLTVQTVPVPAGLILLGSGLVCLLGLRRKAL